MPPLQQHLRKSNSSSPVAALLLCLFLCYSLVCAAAANANTPINGIGATPSALCMGSCMTSQTVGCQYCTTEFCWSSCLSPGIFSCLKACFKSLPLVNKTGDVVAAAPVALSTDTHNGTTPHLRHFKKSGVKSKAELAAAKRIAETKREADMLKRINMADTLPPPANTAPVIGPTDGTGAPAESRPPPVPTNGAGDEWPPTATGLNRPPIIGGQSPNLQAPNLRPQVPFDRNAANPYMNYPSPDQPIGQPYPGELPLAPQAPPNLNSPLVFGGNPVATPEFASVGLRYSPAPPPQQQQQQQRPQQITYAPQQQPTYQQQQQPQQQPQYRTAQYVPTYAQLYAQPPLF